jgi:hypothetical protein
MIRVVVARRDNIYKVQSFGRNHAFGQAGVRLVRASIFVRQRVGQVGVKQQMPALPLNQKTTLAKPPDADMLVFEFSTRPHVCQKGLVLEQRLYHSNTVGVEIKG